MPIRNRNLRTQTTDLVPNAVTQTGIATTTAKITLTSTSYVTMTGMTVSITTVGGDLLVWIGVSALVGDGTVNAIIGVRLDSGTEIQLETYVPYNGSIQIFVGAVHRFTGVAAGAHTVDLRWKLSGSGTASNNTPNNSDQNVLLVAELKK